MIYEKFERLLKVNGLKAFDVSKATGIATSTLSEWKKGKSTPKYDKIAKLAEYFDVPLDYFYDDSFEDYWELVDGEWKWKDKRYAKMTPVYDVAAGEGEINGQYATEYEDLEASDDYEWATIHGDSMLPELKDGDKIRVLKTTEIYPHDYTVVKVNGDTSTVKMVEITGTGVWLRALNKEVYEDRFFSIQEVMTLPVTIIGKVVEVRRVY